MFGWREMAEKVAAVYWSPPPRDRSRAVFYGENYGEAAAIDVFGRGLGELPLKSAARRTGEGCVAEAAVRRGTDSINFK
jgi:hypothetical protein